MPNLPTVLHIFYHRLAIPKWSINKFPKGTALWARKISHSDEN